MDFTDDQDKTNGAPGAFALREPSTIWLVSIFTWGTLYVGLILAIIIQASSSEGLSDQIVMAAIILSLIPMPFIVPLFTQYSVNERGIEKALLGRRKCIRWEEVEQISESVINNGFAISGSNGRILLHFRMVGLDHFAVLVAKKLPIAKYATVISRIESLAGIFDQGRVVSVSNLHVPRDPTKVVVMEYPAMVRGMVLIPYAILLFAICHIMTDYANQSSSLVDYIPLLAIILLTIPLPLELLFTKYTLDDEGIERLSLLRGRRHFSWFEVMSISFSNDNHWFIISSSKKKLRLHYALVGMRDFARIVVSHVPEEKWTEAKRMMLRYAS